jgi:hypothetical protein
MLQMDRLDNVVITPERIQWLKRARLAAIVIFTGFFAMFILFAPEGDARDTNAPAMSASR